MTLSMFLVQMARDSSSAIKQCSVHGAHFDTGLIMTELIYEHCNL